MPSVERCVTHREAIAVLGRLPTERSEALVLIHLLERRYDAGTSLEGLLLAVLEASS
jgi:hypothetical protein